MTLPPASKALLAFVVYLIGVWAMNRALGGLFNGVAVIGIAFVLYGVWYSTLRGARDWGDIAFALAIAVTIGQGIAQLSFPPTSDPVMVIGRGHLYGLLLLAVVWRPLQSQGLLPGGPVRP